MKHSSVSDRMAKVEARYGKTTGASSGSKPAPAAKVKPILSKNKVGVKITKKF